MQRNDEQNAYLDVESTYIIEFGVKSFPISTHSIQQQRFREEYKEVLSFLDLKLKCGHPEKSQMGVLFSFMIRFIPNKNRNYTETRSPTVVTPTTKLFLFNCTLQLYSNKYKNRIFKRFSMRMLHPSRCLFQAANPDSNVREGRLLHLQQQKLCCHCIQMIASINVPFLQWQELLEKV